MSKEKVTELQFNTNATFTNLPEDLKEEVLKVPDGKRRMGIIPLYNSKGDLICELKGEVKKSNKGNVTVFMCAKVPVTEMTFAVEDQKPDKKAHATNLDDVRKALNL